MERNPIDIKLRMTCLGVSPAFSATAMEIPELTTDFPGWAYMFTCTG